MKRGQNARCDACGHFLGDDHVCELKVPCELLIPPIERYMRRTGHSATMIAEHSRVQQGTVKKILDGEGVVGFTQADKLLTWMGCTDEWHFEPLASIYEAA